MEDPPSAVPSPAQGERSIGDKAEIDGSQNLGKKWSESNRSTALAHLEPERIRRRSLASIRRELTHTVVVGEGGGTIVISRRRGAQTCEGNQRGEYKSRDPKHMPVRGGALTNQSGKQGRRRDDKACHPDSIREIS